MAKKNIANLSARLGLNISDFQKGLKTAHSELLGFNKFVSTFAKFSGGVAAGNLLARSIEGIARASVNLVKQSFESAAALGTQADRVGILTEDLYRLQYVAKRTDVPFDALTDSISKMNRNLLGGEGRNILETLGLDPDEFNRMDVLSKFETIAEVIQRIPDPAQRGAAMIKIFGKSGEQLAEMLSLSADEMDRLFQRSDALRGVIDRIDSKKAESAVLAFKDVKEMMTGAGMRAAIELGPWIAATIEEFIDAGNEGTTFGEKVKTAIVDSIKWMDELLDDVKLLHWWFLNIGVSAQDLMAPIRYLFNSESPKELLTQRQDWIAQMEKIKNNPGAEDAWQKRIDRVRARAMELSNPAPEAPPSGPFATFDEDAQKLAADQQKAMETAAEKLFLGTRTPFEEYQSELENIQLLLNSGLITEQDAARGGAKAWEDMLDKITKNQKQLEKTKDTMEDILGLVGEAKQGPGLAPSPARIWGPKGMPQMQQSAPFNRLPVSNTNPFGGMLNAPGADIGSMIDSVLSPLDEAMPAGKSPYPFAGVGSRSRYLSKLPQHEGPYPFMGVGRANQAVGTNWGSPNDNLRPSKKEIDGLWAPGEGIPSARPGGNKWYGGLNDRPSGPYARVNGMEMFPSSDRFERDKPVTELGEIVKILREMQADKSAGAPLG